MWAPFALGVAAGYAIAIPVGAIAVLILRIGMRHGLRQGALAGAGAATADLVYSASAVTVGGVASAALAPILV
ncbi:MAG: lysine transporter LysE, partial [Chloroflexi bacterium]|nr:lysine transporter LysE [Chloroflexota bacterium]